MSAPAGRAAARSLMPAAIAFALRELRGARQGFTVFLLCLALGVAAIAGIGSFARALTEGLDREGRSILGGDASFTLTQREASEMELGFLSGHGEVNRVATLRAMARTAAGDAALAELKAVDPNYPLAGQLELSPPQPPGTLFAPGRGLPGAAAEPALLGRLGLKIGDQVKLGDATFEIRAELVSEPDKLSAGIGLGPRLIISAGDLPATGLIQPGSLVRWSYRVLLPDAAPAALDALMEAAHARFDDAGFEMRTRHGATPQLERSMGRIGQFLTLVALTALLVGGVGIANAVSSHLSAKRATIATLKALGATRAQVFAAYGIEMAVIAAIGIAAGLAVGAAIPFAGAAALSAVIPYPVAPRLDLATLGLATLYGLLVAGLFTVLPLARAQETPAAMLFRDTTGEAGPRLPRRPLIAAALLGLGLVALALATAVDLRAAAIFIAAAAGVFALLRLVGAGLVALARRLPRPRAVVPRLALANIHRPGALTPTVVLSLGLGLSLMVAIGLIDRSLTQELAGPVQEEAPSFFFVDVPSTEEDAFARFIAARAPGAALRAVPMLRGRILSLNGVPADAVRPSADAAWVLQSDRGITFSATLPEGSRLAEGTWWDANESAPLVSFDAKIAAGLGLKVGDSVSVNVLGRVITARIANLREVKWERLGINFVMVFSPATFAGAPHSMLATLTFPGGADAAGEIALLNQVAAAWPAITVVRVKETLEEARRMVENLSLGIRAASLVTLLTSLLVLSGALAAGQQRRVYEAVILKTLGATRARLIAAFALEYAGIGLATALVAVAAGSLAAYGVAVFVMEIGFTFSATVAFGAALGALVVTVSLGLLATLRALSAPPARVLRHL
ncbi:ABC transporter permease [Xanthobacter tagetidis]|uniref:FtsX-like permease family protein n=1 Tax=Xanthobacter tagetidis TaxID=60216 RepID=A0A3L7AE71_9HYPH|nr:FtsX-like permease family protein [Xanthobacter tagetidis]MBB6308524.1 putative ABC transport system permease protein [Xanthobacter tagetidis]RLP78703.1 FtsX-like permease family protein [Xanthobacter tagetidis]